jgi:hypothetical protein
LRDPGLECGSTFKTIDAFQHGQPRVLYHFLGDSPVGYIEIRERQKVSVIAFDQFYKCVFVTGFESFDQLLLVEHFSTSTSVTNPEEARLFPDP